MNTSKLLYRLSFFYFNECEKNIVYFFSKSCIWDCTVLFFRRHQYFNLQIKNKENNCWTNAYALPRTKMKPKIKYIANNSKNL